MDKRIIHERIVNSAFDVLIDRGVSGGLSATAEVREELDACRVALRSANYPMPTADELASRVRGRLVERWTRVAFGE